MVADRSGGGQACGCHQFWGFWEIGLALAADAGGRTDSGWRRNDGYGRRGDGTGGGVAAVSIPTPGTLRYAPVQRRPFPTAPGYLAAGPGIPFPGVIFRRRVPAPDVPAAGAGLSARHAIRHRHRRLWGMGRGTGQRRRRSGTGPGRLCPHRCRRWFWGWFPSFALTTGARFASVTVAARCPHLRCVPGVAGICSERQAVAGWRGGVLLRRGAAEWARLGSGLDRPMTDAAHPRWRSADWPIRRADATYK